MSYPGKIYRYTYPGCDKPYYGSTSQKLNRRFTSERANLALYKAGKHFYCTSFDVISHPESKIELVENYPCNDRNALELREQWWIDHNICVNRTKASTGKQCYDYSKGKIYKIISDHVNLPYIGSTISSLAKRFSEHRCLYRKYVSDKCTNHEVFQIICDKSAKIELLEKYPCSSRSELLAREGYWIQKIPCVNKKVPGRTHKEKLDLRRKRTNNNRIKIRIQRRDYAKRKKEHITAYMKNYYLENKESYNKKRNEIITCECGIKVQKRSLGRHKKTERHLKSLK